MNPMLSVVCALALGTPGRQESVLQPMTTAGQAHSSAHPVVAAAGSTSAAAATMAKTTQALAAAAGEVSVAAAKQIGIKGVKPPSSIGWVIASIVMTAIAGALFIYELYTYNWKEVYAI